jgi:uncharacterized protein (TIGR00369 family)
MTQTILDRIPMPPCARLLGWRLIEQDAERGWLRIGFDGRPGFCNPAGFIQGGILTAMLDDTMGPAAVLASGGKLFTSTIDLHVSFLVPARPGPLFGEAQVIQLGKTVGFIEGQLLDGAGTLIARATTSARLVAVGRAAEAQASV